LYATGSTTLAKLVKPGTPADEVLTFATGATAPSWVAPAGGGKVLQVLSATDSTSRSIGTSWTTGSNTLACTITPSATSSKVLILCHTQMYTGTNSSGFTINRDSTNLGDATYGLRYDGGYKSLVTVSLNYLDSPSSTSAIVYQLYAKSGATSYLNRGGSGTTYTPMAHITVMEIGA